MKTARRRILLLALLLLVFATVYVVRAVGAPPTASGSPLQAGKTYELQFLGTDATVKIVTPPDANGWATVTVVKGFSGQVKGTLFVNMRMAITAQEVQGH